MGMEYKFLSSLSLAPEKFMIYRITSLFDESA